MKRLIILAVFSVLLFGTSPVYAEEFREFSAVIIEKDGESTETNKIYAAIGKSRYDSKNGSEIVVTRYDKKLMWIIFPKYRRYVEEPCTEVQPQNPAPPQEGTFGDLTRKLVGTEFIDSYRTKKYLVTMEWDHADRVIEAKSFLVDEFCGQYHFSTKIKHRSYIKLYFAGRNPILKRLF